ncbi:DUF885 domain-containing protein [Sphingopyxis terrae]|uniref:Uncharacterized conserved protein, DUF885 familyt n=1 Tax=Sphingopyxis terrae subsp. ummariensis TaxID=429001 RepID=A0A1Y6FSH0_9SPHN|nr:DUF885 family protein [Sphingopyxis terrae]PCF90413.1 DUF885 domain-containing protein [Sphingopyxis terrae subsp. ummariensis]SMQ77176.1 Uncharacterized conserved protein, DUF885 familyt [Sphingopyxis terrae subsp. ummariensis]
MIDFALDRRTLLAGMGMASAGLAMPAWGADSADARLDALLTRQFDQALIDDPTRAASLGLDIGARAGLRARFPDWSAAARTARDRRIDADLAALHAIDRGALGDNARVAYDSAEFDLVARQRLARFPYHTGGFAHRAGPYAVTQLGGFYTGVSTFLDSQHPVKTKADADAYIARMEATPALLDDDSAIVRANAAMGVVAPRFIIEQALQQLGRLRDGDAASKTIVASLARRANAIGLTGYDARAQAIFEGPIRAALTRQIEVLTALLPEAGDEAGVSRLPDGPAYYAATLAQHTTTDMTAEQIHQLGLDQLADLHARMDKLLTAQGFKEGSLRQRLDALTATDGQLFANDDAGRAALLAYLNDRLTTIRARLPQVFSRMPRAPYEIRRVPPEIEIGAPGGSAQAGTPDGSRPGIFFINLRDTHEWPRYTLPTLAFHEGAPGHLFENALKFEDAALPLYRQSSYVTAYGEGWGLYAEQVAAELGMYDDDPLGEIGYLASYAFRASRLVVDTGLHAKGWNRQQAIDFMVENSSETPSSARTEIDRYIVYPGQACSYKVGQTAISRLRDEVSSHRDYDIKRFHDVVLGAGRIPLAVLERRVRDAFPT